MFENPGYLVLLVAIPLFVWRIWRAAGRRSVSFSSAIDGLDLPPTLRQRLRWLPTAMTMLALTLMPLTVTVSS